MEEDALRHLKGLLESHRERLGYLLIQQARLGLNTPPHVQSDIRLARRDIQQTKEQLAQAGYPMRDEPGDQNPEGDPIIPLDDTSSGVELFISNPGFSRFYRTLGLNAIITDIRQPPTYHVIEAAMGYGKTALIGELWRGCSGSPGGVLAYLFSKNHGRTRVAQAVRSLYQQIRAIAILPEGLAEENSLLTPQVLRAVASQCSPLLVLLDGLDECDVAERAQLGRLLPDIDMPGVTIVLTIRPSLADRLLRHIPASHLLQSLRVSARGAGVLLHRLNLLSAEDIDGLLQMLGHAEAATLAEQIFAHSGGVPMLALLYVEQPQLLHSAQPLVAYHERVFQHLQESCPAEQHDLLERLLAFLAAAQSPLSLNDLESLLGEPQPQIIALRDLLARYQHMTVAGEMVLDHRFRDYLRDNERTGLAVRQAGERLATWVIGHIRGEGLTSAPLYALRHAAEYLAPTRDLVDLLCRPEWLNTIERRCRARSECTAAVERAMSRAEDAFRESIDVAVVNVIMCAIIRSSLGATLAPELVARLVRLNLWSEWEARDYARNYVSQTNELALAELLDNPDSPISLPAGSAAAEAEESLLLLIALPPGMREVALVEWRRDAEQMGDMASPGGDTGQLENVISALRQPAQQGGGRFPEGQFQQLIAYLQGYTPPLSGAMSDPHFADLLTDIADAWLQLTRRRLAPFWIHQIIGALAHLNRADLLVALELLAPAIRTIFPRSAPDLIAALHKLKGAAI